MKLRLGLIISVFLGTTLFAMDNAINKHESGKADESQNKKIAQNNSTNLLSTTGIPITGIQNLIAQYAKEFRNIKELKETGYIGNIKSIKFSPLFGKLGENKEVNYQLASAFNGDPSGNYIRIWDIITGNCIRKMEAVSNCLSYSHDGKYIAYLDGRNIRTLELESGDISSINIDDYPMSFLASSLAYCSNKKHIIFGNTSSQVKLLTGYLPKDFHHADPEMILGISSVACSPCGNYIAAAGEKKIKIWEIKSRDCVQNLKGHTAFINEIAYSPCGNFLASASNDNSIKIWDVKSGICTKDLNGHISRVTSVSYLPDGKLIVSGSCDGTLRLWDTASGTCIQVINYGNEILSIACSPCGNYIVAGNNKGRIQVLELLDRILLR